MSFLVSIIGFSIIFRQFRIVCADFQLRQNFSFIIYLCLAAFSILFFVIFQDQWIKLWLFFGIFLGTLKFFAFFLKYHAERSLEERIPQFIDSLLVGISAGKSFRSSYQQALMMEPSWFAKQWMMILERLEVGGELESLGIRASSDFADNLKVVDSTPMRQKEQLLFLRKQYSLKLHFRRRSGQLLTQMKWQVGIMSVMYVLLLIFVVTNFGYTKNLQILLISHIIFIAGVFFSAFLIHRGIKWNI